MSQSVITDLSGRAIPPATSHAAAVIGRVISVRPVREAPNEVSEEFMLSGYAALPAGGAAFLQLTDPSTSAPFLVRNPTHYTGRFDAMTVFCPDMVIDVAPYLFASLQMNAAPAHAWGFIPIYPRAGYASVSFETAIDLAPGATFSLYGKNTDVVNAHFLAVYLHGWIWPTGAVEG